MRCYFKSAKFQNVTTNGAVPTGISLSRPSRTFGRADAFLFSFTYDYSDIRRFN